MKDKRFKPMMARLRRIPRRQLVDLLSRQKLVSGDRKIAETLAKNGELSECKKNQIIIQQGASDNDLYLIISGSVLVLVNGRKIATRFSGEHIGEMAVLDIAKVRSATVVASETTVLFRICEKKFSSIANKYPGLWRRIAIEIADRLRERNKFHLPPHSQPVVFIGSSSEGLPEAESISLGLSKDGKSILKLWAKDVFQASKTVIEDLLEMTQESDFAVFLATPDDISTSRGKKRKSPRDNIIFELGLFMGALSRSRVFFITPEGVDMKIPTDLLGVTHLRYKAGRHNKHRFRSVINYLTSKIAAEGPK